MDHGQGSLESSVQRLNSRVTLLVGTITDDGLGVLDIHIAQLVVPVAVDNQSRLGELTILNGNVDVLGSAIHLVKNPSLRQSLAPDDAELSGNKVLGQTSQDVLGRLEDLVTELAVTVNDLDVQVDISTASGGVDHGKSQGIGTALRNTIWEGSLLVLGSLLDLAGV